MVDSDSTSGSGSVCISNSYLSGSGIIDSIMDGELCVLLAELSLSQSSVLESFADGPCALFTDGAGDKGDEFSQCPRRRGRQFEHSLPAFLQEQFLHRPLHALALHRQHTTGMPQLRTQESQVT